MEKMTEAQMHAKKRVKEAVKYVMHRWGNGWLRLSDDFREALVRAEVLAEIARIPHNVDLVRYKNLVDAMAMEAMDTPLKNVHAEFVEKGETQ